MMRQPSDREIWTRTREALEALQNGRFEFATQKHIYGDLAELKVESASELVPLLIVLLGEIQVAGPEKVYAGARPPLRSHEPRIQGLDLWAFSWHSDRLGKKIYLKFALKKGWYCYVDCHKDKPIKR